MSKPRSIRVVLMPIARNEGWGSAAAWRRTVEHLFKVGWFEMGSETIMGQTAKQMADTPKAKLTKVHESQHSLLQIRQKFAEQSGERVPPLYMLPCARSMNLE